MVHSEPDTEELLAQAGRGNAAAREQLLARHRNRLRQMIAVRMDRRLAARVDPSDVVQEALLEAAQNLSDYLRERPVAFYPWLRRMAWERLIDLHRRHIVTRKRSVNREEAQALPLSNDSAQLLANRLFAIGSSPSERLVRSEQRARVRAALTRLADRDREVLVLRHLENLSVHETAAVLGITEGAAKSRHLRALERLRLLLEAERGELQ